MPAPHRLFVTVAVWYLMAIAPSVSRGQSDLYPAAPLPPPVPAKNVKAFTLKETEALLQKQIDAFKETITKVHKTDPQRAAQLVRDLGSAATLIRTRAIPSGDATSSPNATLASMTKPRFAFAEREIERLQNLGEVEASRDLHNQLTKLESAFDTGEYQPPARTLPEVHRIKLKSGTTLPIKFRTKENRFNKSYAEIHLHRTGAPVILVLECRTPTLWNIKAAPGVNVFAVVVDSLSTQTVIGLDAPLLLDTETAAEQQLLDFRTLGSHSRGELLSGSKAKTAYIADRYAEPIIVGPTSRLWLAAFLDKETENLIQACQQQRRDVEAQQIKELRYAANYVVQVDSNERQFCRAEFNAMGPIADSLIPHQSRSLRQSLIVPDGDQPVHFGLTTSGVLVTHDTKANAIRNNLAPVPLSGSIFGSRTRIRALAYDSKRHRLLCAPTGNQGMLAALDIKSGDWSLVGQYPHPLIGVAYASESDEIWAVAMQYAPIQTTTGSDATFVKIDGLGKVTLEKPISQPLLNVRATRYAGTFVNRFLNQTLELIVSGQYAVLTGTRPVGDENLSEVENYHFVINSQTGELAYEGVLRINDGIRTPSNVVRNSAYSVMANSISTLSQVDELILTCDESSKIDLQSRIDGVRGLLRGDESKRRRSRVYMIGRYASTHPVNIRLTDRSGPITLILSSNQQVKWNIELAKGVELDRVIADGAVNSTVQVSDKNVPIKVHSGKDALQLLNSNRHLHLGRLAEYVLKRTGLEPAAIMLLSASRASAAIDVGPSNGAVRLKLAHNE